MTNVHLNSCIFADNRSSLSMDEDLFNPLDSNSASAFPKADTKLQIDPKLLTKALNKMRGLIKGNGLSEDKIVLIDTIENTEIKMYRFKARTSLKLVPQYGTRTEPGRNATAEVIPSEAEFKRAVSQIAIDARTNPQKRKEIIDFIFGRSDKGFGIKEQRTKFHILTKDYVQHDKCNACANTGKLTCVKCHGNALMPCPKCLSKKHVMCPKCRGDGRIKSPNGSASCQFCRGDGRVNCKTCGARGQVKCQNCAATGAIPCRICAASGWMSNLTHVEVFAQITFDFDSQGLPPSLVQAIEKNPSRCVEKHDIEVSIVRSKTTDNTLDAMGKPQGHTATDNEPEDTIYIDYEAMCPYGPITFQIDGKPISGSLFGFQARLLNFPYFMDELVKDGRAALLNISKGGKNIRSYLVRAAKFRLIADIIAQTLWIKNTIKAKNFLMEKYQTGVNPDLISELVDLTDIILRHITRRWRTIGLIIGFVLFAALLEIHFLSDGREYFKSLGLPEMAVVVIDILMFPLGVVLGVFFSKFAAKWSQDRTLHKIVPSDVLNRTLPKAGKTVHWSMIASAMMIVVFLAIAVINGGPIPDWLNYLVILTLSIIHAG